MEATTLTLTTGRTLTVAAGYETVKANLATAAMEVKTTCGRKMILRTEMIAMVEEAAATKAKLGIGFTAAMERYGWATC
jgi:hypothetical protein